jgi:hypothetical protein
MRGFRKLKSRGQGFGKIQKIRVEKMRFFPIMSDMRSKNAKENSSTTRASKNSTFL